jgi:hypothetical protein
VRRWNALMPPELAGQPMPPRAKMDENWRLKVFKESLGTPTDVEKAATDHIANAAALAAGLVGRARAALMLLSEAEMIAPPGRVGRTPGSGTHNARQVAEIMATVLKRDDGSPGGGTKAIAAAIANEPARQRAALKKLLRRRLPPPLGLDKIRT